jgi:hypothetical protein
VLIELANLIRKIPIVESWIQYTTAVRSDDGDVQGDGKNSLVVSSVEMPEIPKGHLIVGRLPQI